MPGSTFDHTRQATRLKMALDLARADYDRAQGLGWTQSELHAAATHYRLCNAVYRAFLAQGPGQDEPEATGAWVPVDLVD